MLPEQYKITSTDGDKTTFRIFRGEIIPYSNFKLACEWYTSDRLTPKNKVLMERIIKKQNKKNRRGMDMK